MPSLYIPTTLGFSQEFHLKYIVPFLFDEIIDLISFDSIPLKLEANSLVSFGKQYPP